MENKILMLIELFVDKNKDKKNDNHLFYDRYVKKFDEEHIRKILKHFLYTYQQKNFYNENSVFLQRSYEQLNNVINYIFKKIPNKISNEEFTSMNKLSQILLEYDYEININRNWNQPINNALEEQKRVESIINNINSLQITNSNNSNIYNNIQLNHIYVFNTYDIPITYRLLPDKTDINNMNNYSHVIMPQQTTDDLNSNNLTSNTTDINHDSMMEDNIDAIINE